MASEEDERLELALAIIKAMSSEEFTSIRTFMEKFYKRSLSERKNKISEIRMTRFNALLSKLDAEFKDLTSNDLETAFSILFCLLTRVSSFMDDKTSCQSYEDKIRLISATYHWTGQLIAQAAEYPDSVDYAVQLLDWILKGNKLKVPTLEEFQQKLANSPYFCQAHLSQQEEVRGNSAKNKDVVIQQQDLATSVLRHCNMEALLSGLVSNLSSITQAFDYFILLSQKGLIVHKFKLFWKVFVQNMSEDEKETTEFTNFLEGSIRNGMFDCQCIGKVEQLIASIKSKTNQKGDLKLEFPLGFVLKQEHSPSKESVQDLISDFVASTSPSYDLLHFIIKSQESVPKSVWKYLVDTGTLDNRKGIMVAFQIAQSSKCQSSDLLKFYQTIGSPSEEQQVHMLQILHFSLQQHPIQCSLLTKILHMIKPEQLVQKCDFTFLPTEQPLQKPKFSKGEKTQISELLNLSAQTTNEALFKIKNRLASQIGQSGTLLSNVEKVISITSKKLEDMIESLYTQKNQDIVQVVIMRINQLLSHKYVQDVGDKVLDWVSKSYTAYTQTFTKLAKDYFASINKTPYLNMAISLKMYNLCQKSTNNWLMIPGIQGFFKENPDLQLVDQQYSSYLVCIGSSNALQWQCSRAWKHLSELIRFLRLLDQKNHNKKQIKKILERLNCPTIYILQALFHAQKNNIKNKQLITKLIGLLETDYEAFQSLQKKSVQIQVDCYFIQNFFDFLLEVSYEETVKFICGLLKSSKFSKNQKPQKKKRGGHTRKSSKTETETNKVIKSLMNCLPMLLNQPNRLRDIGKMTDIVEKLIQYSNNDNEEQLSKSLINWVSQFNSLTFGSFPQMEQKIKCIAEFWHKIFEFMKSTMESSENRYIKYIEQQFTQFTVYLEDIKVYSQQLLDCDLMENRILQVLQMLFDLQRTPEWQGIRHVEEQKIVAIFNNNQKRNPENMYFFCEDCEKNICECCYSFMHRNHDVNFVGKEKGSCSHEPNSLRQRPPQNGRPGRPERFFSRYLGEDMEELGRLDQGDQFSQDRITYMHRLFTEKKRDREDRIIMERVSQAGMEMSIPMMMMEQNTFAIHAEDFRELAHHQLQQHVVQAIQPLPVPAPVPQPVVDDQNTFEVKSTTEKSIVETNTRQNTNTQTPIFETQTKYFEECPKSIISMGRLLKWLISNLSTSKITGLDGNQSGIVQVLERYNFETAPSINIEITQDKCNMLKLSYSKPPGGRPDFQGLQRAQRGLKMFGNGKPMICSNQRHIVVAIGSTITFLQESKLRKSYKRKEKAKRFNQVQGEEGYESGRKMNVAFDIIDAKFPDGTGNYLGVLGNGQFSVIVTGHTNREYKRYNYAINTNGEVTSKFQWVPSQSNKFMVLVGKEVRLYQFDYEQMSLNPQLTLLHKISNTKQIKDFTIRYNHIHSVYTCFFCDVEGVLSQQKFNMYGELYQQHKIALPQHKEPINSIMVSSRSDLCFLSFKDGSNLVVKLLDDKVSRSQNIKFGSRLNNINMESLGGCMVNVRQLYSSNEISVMACIFRRDSNSPSSGNFAIVQMYGQKNINVLIQNQSFRTEDYKIISYDEEASEQKFTIVGVQADGFIWMKSYELRKLSNRVVREEHLIDDKIDTYNKNLAQSGFLRYDVGAQKAVDYKQHSKLQFQEVNVANITRQIQIVCKQQAFITGVSLRVEQLGRIKFKLLGSVFQFNVKKPRELQIPLSARQSILSFVQKKLTIQVQYHKPISVQLQVYGVLYERNPKLSDIYKQLVQLWIFNFGYDPKDVCHYFSNPSRFDFYNVNTDKMMRAFKDTTLDTNEINFILKLQLLVQAAEESSHLLSSKSIQEFISSSRKYINIDKMYMTTSIKRMYKKIFEIYKKTVGAEGRSIVFGDAFDYYTFKDTLTVEHRYKDFLVKSNHNTFDQLTEVLLRIKAKRVCNLYLILALFPTLIWRLTNYFTTELDRISESNKRKVGDRLVCMIALVCEYFQYLKNKNKAAQTDTFRLLELLLTGISKNKELFKELILRSFQYLQTAPLHHSVVITYGCSLFQIGSQPPAISMQQEQHEHQPSPASQMMQQEKQYQEDEQQMMRMDEDQEEIRQVTERSQSIHIFLNHIEKSLKIGDCNKLLTQNRKTTELQLEYHDIIYSLTLGLFDFSVIKPETTNFYIGLFYNLLNILDIRIYKYDKTRSQKMVENLLRSVNKQLANKESSALFLALAHFLEPNYNKIREKPSSETPKIRDLIVDYYIRNPQDLPFNLLERVNIQSGVQKTIKLKQALSFNEINCNSLIYQIKYLGNLYLCLMVGGMDTRSFHKDTKEFVLKMYVKKKLRVYKNILVLQKWIDDIQDIKYKVAFEQLEGNEIETGLQRILSASGNTSGDLVQFLKTHPDKFSVLQNLLDRDLHPSTLSQVIEVLNEYYVNV